MRPKVEFLRQKDYKFIKELGQGGTGKAVLLLDEYINEQFVCKKYSPFNESDKTEYFNNFVDEIKLLHLMYHKNVVRVFNYYLYPESTTGYILMEFIDGEKITDFIKQNPEKLNDIFVQTLEAFKHLEEIKVLHRDLRPENILITKNGTVKVIDFGFGKRIDFDSDFDKSLSLNWRYSPPSEFRDKIYDFKTEVYFVGKMFEEIIQENNLQNFTYATALKSMTLFDAKRRTLSFLEVQRDTLEKESESIEFTSTERNGYKWFADDLIKIISKLESSCTYRTDIDAILTSLKNIYRDSMLETHLQDNELLSRTFIAGVHYIVKSPTVEIGNLKRFISLLESVSTEKRKIILNHLWKRFDKLERYSRAKPNRDDLPF